jgi:hypothetical protein
MKIAILNDIHVGPPLVYKQTVRAASHLTQELLPKVIQQIVSQHSPDLFINLGDLIRSENLELDLRKYSSAIQYFYDISCAVLHLIGNHEIKCMSLSQIEDVWLQQGLNQKSYGSMQLDELQLIWLGMETDIHCKKSHRLPKEQFDWLKRTLVTTNQPTLVFTHCAIDDQDLNGNFFYETVDERQRKGFFLQNQENIRQLLNTNKWVKAVFQAHLHHFHSKTINGISYITCPAMGDNICGPNMLENIPEIYTLLTFDNSQLSIKAFARDYCFAGTEVILSDKA